MHPNPFPSFLIKTFIILIIHVPTSLCIEDERHLNCSKTFDCANMKNIGYPFWGQNRSESCGHPGFELNCTGDAPEITMENTVYRILSMNKESYTLSVVRDDYWNDYCPKHLINTTLDFSHFSYHNTTQNLTLYYGCTVSGVTTYQFTCNINDTDLIGYYTTKNLATNLTLINSFGNYSDKVIVPVTLSATQTSENNSATPNLTTAINGGFEVQWAANNSLCLACTESGGQCGYNLSSLEFTCYCSHGPSTAHCGGHSSMAPRIPERIHLNLPTKVAIGVLASVAGIIVVFIVLICCVKQGYISYKIVVFWKKKTENDQNVEAFIRNYGSLTLKRYSYSDVKKMTKSLKEKLGRGGYGSVYKGKLSNGHLVAVKVLRESKDNGEEFMNEVASISRTSHVNIVTLLGFCYERTKRALIYEFMPNGSLDKFIYDEGSPNGNRHLEWKTLYQIAIGIARGLEYLHRGCNTRILHFDIKPHNILLDEDFCPKVSDFGLAKLCQRKESIISMPGARGTIGYIAPEVFCRNFGGVSHKSDVYSYGMMVLEMVGGRKNIDPRVSHTSEIYFPHWIYEPLKLGVDLKLCGVVTEEEEEITRKMILVSLWCIQTKPSDRPPMTKVIEMLEGSLQSLKIPPKPYLSSPPRSPQQYSSTTATLS